MNCESCQSRACLSNGGYCVENPRPPETPQQRLERLREEYLRPGAVFRHPTEKQISCVNRWIRDHDFDSRRPSECTREAYSEFIRDVICRNDYEDDEEYLNWIGAYDNDLWCEHY